MAEAPALPTTLTAVLAEGYRAHVLLQGDKAKVEARCKEALESNAPLRAEASRELLRLSELEKKSNNQLDRRCTVSAQNLKFLKLILGATDGR